MTKARELSELAKAVTISDNRIDFDKELQLSNASITADINFGDNDKAIFGAGSDLQIYHDGSHSVIKDTGTGNLQLYAGLRHQFYNADGSSLYAQFVADGGVGTEYVQLRYGNATKLATTSTGIDVTGTVTADGLTVEGSTAPTINIKSTDTVVVADDVVGAITFEESDATGGTGVQAFIKAIANDSGSTYDMSIGVGGNAEAIRIDQNKSVTLAGNLNVSKVNANTVFDGLTGYSLLKIRGDSTLRLDFGTSADDDAGRIQYDAPPTNVMRFYTDGAERMRIDSSGNVGIGTSSPAWQLHVKSTSEAVVQIEGASNAGSFVNFGDPSDTDVGQIGYDHTSNYMRFKTNASEHMRILAGGNVGIGTSSPGTRLEVAASGGTPGIRLRRTDITNSDVDLLTGGGSTGKDFLIKVNQQERMRIDSNGNIGIGSSSTDALESRIAQGYRSLRLNNFNINAGEGAYGFIGQNIYQDSAGVYKFIDTNDSSSIHFWGNSMQFHMANGSADATQSGSERMRLNSSGNLGIGTTSPADRLHIVGSNGATTRTSFQTASQLVVENNSDTSIDISTGPTHSGFLNFHDTDAVQQGYIGYGHTNDLMVFGTNGSEKMRIESSGKFGINTSSPNSTFEIVGTNENSGTLTLIDSNKGNRKSHIHFGSNGDWYIRSSTSSGFVTLQDNNEGTVYMGKTNGSSSVEGARFSSGVNHHITMNGAQVILFNRNTNDGSIIGLAQADSTEGNISVSGNTISYNAFSASHWSRLTDNSKPTILKGTVIETIDEMMDWYQLTFTVPATDDTPEHSPKISIALEDGQSVGDTITYNHDGIDYQATIIQEGDNKHTKCKISDTADSTRVYGVFADWDNDDDSVNDMYVTAVGTHVVRIHSSVTVSAGDLLVSNGDGTAKVQDDDIIRSKTIGKVLTNIVQETYDDGSYTVPCALYCG